MKPIIVDDNVSENVIVFRDNNFFYDNMPVLNVKKVSWYIDEIYTEDKEGSTKGIENKDKNRINLV